MFLFIILDWEKLLPGKTVRFPANSSLTSWRNTPKIKEKFFTFEEISNKLALYSFIKNENKTLTYFLFRSIIKGSKSINMPELKKCYQQRSQHCERQRREKHCQSTYINPVWRNFEFYSLWNIGTKKIIDNCIWNAEVTWKSTKYIIS